MDHIMLRLIILTVMIAVGVAIFRFVLGRKHLRSRSRADERAHARAVARAAASYRRDDGEPTYSGGASRAAPPPSGQE
jgi:hypothetical protein